MQGFIINKSRQGLTIQAKILQNLVDVAHVDVDFLFKRIKHNRLVGNFFIILSFYHVLKSLPISQTTHRCVVLPKSPHTTRKTAQRTAPTPLAR
ncbi:hypothetical protein [Moraxella lacunata]|uniref:hypothetical protein n=1 Tax=Moraxella lacunata TaxID=477 RepID=UPI003EE41594